MAGEHFARKAAPNSAPAIRRCLCGRCNHHPADPAVRPVVAHVRQGHRVYRARPAMSHQLGDRRRVESGALCRFADRVPQHRGHRQPDVPACRPWITVQGAQPERRRAPKRERDGRRITALRMLRLGRACDVSPRVPGPIRLVEGLQRFQGAGVRHLQPIAGKPGRLVTRSRGSRQLQPGRDLDPCHAGASPARTAIPRRSALQTRLR